jgi:phosphatidylglycerophosphatase A
MSDPPLPSALSRWATFLATGFGSGYSPFAPGTAGSAVGLVLFWPMRLMAFPYQLALLGITFALGVASATVVAKRLGIEDPGIVVVDEIVGMWISLLLLPFTLFTALAGFVLFRVMDVWKPYPARDLEALPGGWGIMLDDVMAGVYANLVLRVILRVLA